MSRVRVVLSGLGVEKSGLRIAKSGVRVAASGFWVALSGPRVALQGFQETTLGDSFPFLDCGDVPIEPVNLFLSSSDVWADVSFEISKTADPVLGQVVLILKGEFP